MQAPSWTMVSLLHPRARSERSDATRGHIRVLRKLRFLQTIPRSATRNDIFWAIRACKCRAMIGSPRGRAGQIFVWLWVKVHISGLLPWLSDWLSTKRRARTVTAYPGFRKMATRMARLGLPRRGSFILSVRTLESSLFPAVEKSDSNR